MTLNQDHFRVKKKVTSNLKHPTILHEDNHLLIVNKPSGLLVQGDQSGDWTLKDWAEKDVAKRFNKPGKAFIGLPHRLDRPSSGIVILAKTSKSLTRVSQLFAERAIKKTYWAIVEGKPKNNSSRLVNSLWKDPKQKKSFISTKKEAKEAILKYAVISAGERYSLLEIILETGRHHQIRCQLSAIGHPIKGDLKYGAKRSNKNGSISLHAQKISLKHPVKSNSITLTAPPPNESLWIQLSEKIEKDYFHQ